jgi:hypothetical protein
MESKLNTLGGGTGKTRTAASGSSVYNRAASAVQIGVEAQESKIMTNEDILISLKSSTVSHILDTCSNLSERGFMYEALWNIVVKFNCLPDI